MIDVYYQMHSAHSCLMCSCNLTFANLNIKSNVWGVIASKRLIYNIVILYVSYTWEKNDLKFYTHCQVVELFMCEQDVNLNLCSTCT